MSLADTIDDGALAVAGLDRAAVRRIVPAARRHVGALQRLKQLASEMHGVLEGEFKVAAPVPRLASLPPYLLTRTGEARTDLLRLLHILERVDHVAEGDDVALKSQYASKQANLTITRMLQACENVDFVARPNDRLFDALVIVIANRSQLAIELVVKPCQRDVLLFESVKQRRR